MKGKPNNFLVYKSSAYSASSGDKQNVHAAQFVRLDCHLLVGCRSIQHLSEYPTFGCVKFTSCWRATEDDLTNNSFQSCLHRITVSAVTAVLRFLNHFDSDSLSCQRNRD